MTASYMDKYKNLATKVTALQELLKPRDLTAVNKVGSLASKIEEMVLKTHEEDGNPAWEAEAIVKSGIENIVDVFFDALSWRKATASSLSALRKTGNGQRLLSSYLNILRCITCLTDKYTSFCIFAIEKSLIETMIDELNEPELVQQRNKPNDQTYDDFDINYMLILSNITGRTTKAVSRFKSKSITTLKMYCEGNNYSLMTLALFALSCVAAENEKFSISYELATHIVALLKAALRGDFTGLDFYLTTTELLQSLGQVANSSDNCVTKLVDASILDVLDAILTAPAPKEDSKADRLVHQPPSDASKLVDFTDDTEKLLTIKLFWMAKFTKSVRETLVSRKSTVEALQKLAQTDSSVNAEIQSEAKNLLESLFDERKALPESGRLLSSRKQRTPSKLKKPTADKIETEKTSASNSNNSKKGDRIFVSYSHKQQQIVFSVVSKLRAAGFANVVTDQSIESDWYTWMVEQVEQADIVLVCFSKAYYESGNCKDEATNARALGKKIIPLKMEDYDPISWLGGITRVRLWRDYWIPDKFDDSVAKLIGEINKHLTAADDTTDNAQSARTDKLHSKHSHDSAVTKSTQPKVMAHKPTDSAQQPPIPLPSTQQLANVDSWDEQKTKRWLEGVEYPAAQVRPGSLNGTFVTTLVHFARTEPKFLLELLLQHKGVSLDQALLILGKLVAGPTD